MKVEIVNGEHAGKTGELLRQTIGAQSKLAGGESIHNAVSVLVEGILHPIELERSDVKPVHEETK